MKTFRIRLLATLALMGWAFPALAQLPELATPSTATGAPTSARFFGGVSADNGATFGNSFDFGTPLDITGSIQVEESHVNTVGNLYIVAQLGEQLLFRDASGNYLPWDLNLATLQAASPDKTLASSEPLTIVDDIPLGPAGAAGLTLSVFLAYDTSAAPGELFYSGAPITVAVGTEPPAEPASLTLYTQNVSAPIVQGRCVACHVSGGVAGSTPLVYVRSNTPDFVNINYNTLVNYIKNHPNGSSLILSKPQGVAHGGGVQLPSGSENFTNFSNFVNAVLAE